MVASCVSQTSVISYLLTYNEDNFEGNKVIQYGLEQSYINEMGETIVTRICSISDDKNIVEELINRLMEEDVYPGSLIYIVEDYIVEISEI